MARQRSSKAAPRPRRRGALSWLAGLLAASAVLRLLANADVAFAVETAVAEEPAAEPHEMAASGDLAGCIPQEGTAGLIEAFQAREARIVERESQLAERAQALNVVEAELTEKLAALSAAEESLAAMIALAETAASDDLARLTAVYENMKPQDAAALFETMDPAFSAGFLGLMQPAAAAAIMTNLEPETAYSISVILAGRNAGAPTE